MALSAERLAEIDAELEAFGKPDDELAGVVERAKRLAATLSGDDAPVELLEGLDDAMAAAAEAARSSIPKLPAPMRRRPATGSTSIGSPAPAAQPDDEPEEPVIGSGLVEIPEDELRKADLPPVLELGPKGESGFPDERTDRVEAEDFEAAVGGAANSDIRGLSVDELFADAADDESGPMSAADLARFTLDEDEESIRLSDPELELEAIEEAPPTPTTPPRPKTVPPPLPPGARAARKPPAMDLRAFDEDESDSTQVMTAADLGGLGDDSDDSDDDFELLVDEDAIDHEEAPTEVDEQTDVQDPEASGGGLISRILGRK